MEFWHSPLLPQVESRRSCQDISCYRPHTHDRFSIGLVDSGTTVFTGASGEPIELAAGDVILIPAGHVHSCNPRDGRWEYQMIHAAQDWILALAPAAVRMTDGISIFRDRHLHEQFTAVNELLFSDADSEQLESAFRTALTTCATREPHRRLDDVVDDALVQRLRPVLARLFEARDNPTLDELAHLAGMGKYQLIRAMKRATGFPPVAWLQNERVGVARKLLRNGHSIADAAHTLGFTDQSHFHRVFRAHVAATPGAYRR
ncbi:AraC family transcriptional regulator [Rhodococcus sp. BP-252]|uniref:helix-turn-helix transcriptional regulator n=1 Tax=unclassified Rhodococcus (in: high G+C Gram-positive bacteria) TaxID=192944 RepID=UPI001C9B13FE|nr:MULTISPECIES: helix-turn-helix domain-containing protein [unclassified Rhodococcus (in: high G+C Gram-positive bacteria)]MBY6414761.1 AraC family transcriptional regulator [Rhodococcus sp. BP-320]MBY6419665.1 AraC family transcriptional regulator [Rhodococcus sp. BP-321]MBY6424642.1 AraC family transcriptional regulator [Rhodococcus sp. BP-324]MBY6429639.1 AraC family transcriptional regulator [Rhodococcus sp. BP-323]MBY6434639.1 AraC family transcriptional regulator [Rhodococcus sp. BP-322